MGRVSSVFRIHVLWWVANEHFFEGEENSMLKLHAVAQRVWQWKNPISRRWQRAAARRSPVNHVRPCAEPLEPRRMLALVADFGDITNPASVRIVDDLATVPFDDAAIQTVRFS